MTDLWVSIGELPVRHWPKSASARLSRRCLAATRYCRIGLPNASWLTVCDGRLALGESSPTQPAGFASSDWQAADNRYLGGIRQHEPQNDHELANRGKEHHDVPDPVKPGCLVIVAQKPGRRG